MLSTILCAALLTNDGALNNHVPTFGIGASGVAFGIIGCAVAADPRAKTATGVIARQLALVNVVLTFLIPGISIGGHFGGFLAGLVIGWAGFSRARTTDHPAGRTRRGVAVAAIALALPIMAVVALGPSVLPDQAREPRGTITAWLLSRQLSGATLDNGRRIDEADCDWTGDDPSDYACSLDGADAIVRFSSRDDQWSLRVGQ
jgi:hypothetical protein